MNRRFNKNIFIVTCRFEGYRKIGNASQSFLQIDIQPFSKPQALEFITNWLIYYDNEKILRIANEKAQDLVGKVEEYEAKYSSEKMTRMLENPLLLSILCIVYTKKYELPQKISKLFLECIDILLEDWHQSKNINFDLNRDDGKRILMPVAFDMHDNEVDIIKREELQPKFEKIFELIGRKDAADLFIDQIVNDSGILTGIDNENLKFMHLGFQEYLVAREIRRRWCENDPVPMEIIVNNLSSSWWREVAFHLVALEEPSIFIPFMELTLDKLSTENIELIDQLLDTVIELPIKPFQKYFLNLSDERSEIAQILWDKLKSKDINISRFLLDLKDNEQASSGDNLFNIVGLDTYTDTVIDYTTILLPEGNFKMGDADSGYLYEKPTHIVNVKSFNLGQYPVTNRQYQIYLEENPHAPIPNYLKETNFNKPDQPIVGISWIEAKAFIEWLSDISKTEYRLPSEAEWEYACRAGTTTPYHAGEDENDLANIGWFNNNSENTLHMVGGKAPNIFGLHDMHGNIYEWIEDDWYSNYKKGPSNEQPMIQNPRNSLRVLRGGAWYSTLVIDCEKL